MIERTRSHRGCRLSSISSYTCDLSLQQIHSLCRQENERQSYVSASNHQQALGCRLVLCWDCRHSSTFLLENVLDGKPSSQTVDPCTVVGHVPGNLLGVNTTQQSRYGRPRNEFQVRIRAIVAHKLLLPPKQAIQNLRCSATLISIQTIMYRTRTALERAPKPAI